MKILMIAPEPFFEPRGTPFSEYYRIKALCEMGHRVDLVTYPIGQDKDIDGLRIFRSLRLPFIKSVKTGPSAAKIFLDFFLFFKAWFRLIRGKYDAIHTHEEANIMGAFLNKVSGVPHLYDMHSSLVQQMNNFQFSRSKIVVGFFKWIEKISLKNARSIIVICPSLFDYAGTITETEKLTIIENFRDETPDTLDTEKLTQMRALLDSNDPEGKINEKESESNGKNSKTSSRNSSRNSSKNSQKTCNKKIIMYTGTLETYQGIPLLLDAMALLNDTFRLVLVGGKPSQVEAVRESLKEKGITNRVVLLGSRPPAEMPYFLAASDALVSPRILGTNIPLKIYSYLKSGVPVVATDLYTHTQSIDATISILVKPEAEDFAQGIRDAVSGKGEKIATNAAAFCNKNYSHERYLELVSEALAKAVS